jgi:hypothetical protein
MLLVLSGLLPDIEVTLAALDHPFHLIPMTRAIINGVTHYGAVPDLALRVPGIIGVALIAGGYGLRRTARAMSSPRGTPLLRRPARGRPRSRRLRYASVTWPSPRGSGRPSTFG